MVKQKISQRRAGWVLLSFGLFAQAALAQEGLAQAPSLVPNAADALRPQAVKLGIDAFGKTAEIEVRDLPRESAKLAIEEALREIYHVSLYADPDGNIPGGLGELNQAAGKKEISLDRRAFELLIRGLQFCAWSNGVYSPAGGAVYTLWRKEASPYPADLQAAVATTGCQQVRLAGGEAGNPGRATLAAGTRAEAFGIQEGVALDRAIDILRKHGIRNAMTSLGPLKRALGVGPDGHGWLVDIPGVLPTDSPADQVWLVDQSLSITRADDAFLPVDLRNGLRPRGTFQVAAVTELAADAQGLTTTLFVLSQTKGLQQLGALQPRPSVFWLVGQTGSSAVESTYRWTILSRPNSLN